MDAPTTRPASPQPRTEDARPPAPAVADLRALEARRGDRSAHRQHAWLFEDLLA